jgi:hypothetical protein
MSKALGKTFDANFPRCYRQRRYHHLIKIRSVAPSTYNKFGLSGVRTSFFKESNALYTILQDHAQTKNTEIPRRAFVIFV